MTDYPLSKGTISSLDGLRAVSVAIVFAGHARLSSAILGDLGETVFRSPLRYSMQGLELMPLFHYAVTQPRMKPFHLLNWGWERWVGVTLKPLRKRLIGHTARAPAGQS